jgi:drug/metabolite transporter (DMT)-like permease
MAGLFGKWVSVGAMLLVFGRVAFATLALGAVLAAGRKRVLPYGGRAGWLLPVCGAVLAFHWAAFFHAIQVSTVAIGLLGYATAPIFAGFLEPWWFREPFSRRTLAASLITLAGIALIVPAWSGGDAIFVGTAWGIAAGLSFAVLSLLNRHLRVRYDSVTLAFYQDGAATLLVAPFLPLFWSRPGPTDLLLLALLGVVFTALAHGLFIQALKTVRARVATLVSNLEPVYGIALAALLLGEIPTPRTLAGGTLILLAVAWVTIRPEQPLAGQQA